MNKPLYTDIPEDLHHKLREHCFKTERTKREVVIDALEKHLALKPQIKSTSPHKVTNSSSIVVEPRPQELIEIEGKNKGGSESMHTYYHSEESEIEKTWIVCFQSADGSRDTIRRFQDEVQAIRFVNYLNGGNQDIELIKELLEENK